MTQDNTSSSNPVVLRDVALDDKYDLSASQVYVSGTQAVVRMLLMQSALDKKAGLNTAGFVCGYRGSPIAGLDQQVMRARKHLQPSNIVFQAGLNEDLAATACWGSQQAELRGEGAYDGVFAVWYGKGPGVDRTGDVFRHANMAGSSQFGGVLALMGDDHTCESSTVAHQTELAFIDWMMPVLNPCNVQEMIDYGLYGYALSRFAGVWVALKCVKDNIEQTASVDGSLDRISIALPDDYALPEGGLNIRLGDNPLAQEERLFGPKMEAVQAFVRANKIDRTLMSGGKKPWLGIVTVGKSTSDVLEALDDLGIDEVTASKLGIRLYKVGCPWPLEKQGALAFADGLKHILVVEEKRSIIESQLKELLYHKENAPVIEGKHDLYGRVLFPAPGGLDPNDIAIAIGERIEAEKGSVPGIVARVRALRDAQEQLQTFKNLAERVPTFCSGCPHNTSTKVPEGMRASAGIGCHFMVQWMERNSEGVTQMGGEGANWVGEGRFSKRKHIFQNLGDGTYSHSGSIALRFAITSGLNITYKILYNDAVAMTGGQPVEGGLTVPMIAHQVAAEGVQRIALVSDEPWKYNGTEGWPQGMTFHTRDEMDALQRELSNVEGVSVLIYDQTCAAEKRRRRKRGQFPDPDKRVFINERVCEGCGDCGVQSNCVSLQPVETEFGRKRQIDQTSCNKDFSCVNGFCPSFVTIEGAKLRSSASKTALKALETEVLPDPVQPSLEKPWAVVITGVGGTGITTLAAVMGMAAHLEGKGVGIIDMAGLAQKGGAVYSHMRIAASPEAIKAIRVSAQKADLLLGGDLMVSATKKVLGAIKPDQTMGVVNMAEVYPGDFARHADYTVPTLKMKAQLESAKAKDLRFLDINAVANRLFGNTVAANMMMCGFAYQMGALPLSSTAMERAITLNGEAVNMNIAAFRAGRLMAHNPSLFAVDDTASLRVDRQLSESLDHMIERRVATLTAYQNAAYAQRYLDQVQAIRALDAQVMGKEGSLSEAVARYLFKLMAYKDEYEVARLYSDGAFLKDIEQRFEGDLRLHFHLAPPLLSRIHPSTGRPMKITFGPWMLKVFGALASFKVLRGTPFDIFGYTDERKTERALIERYAGLLSLFQTHLRADNYATAVALARLPEGIRGYGPVKEAHLHKVEAQWERLQKELLAAPQPPVTLMAAE